MREIFTHRRVDSTPAPLISLVLMNWRLVLILLKLIDRFGFPYFLVLVSFWFAKAIEQELQRRVTSPSLSSRWSALSAKRRHKNNQRPSAMKRIMKFSPGKLLSTGFVILAALAVAVVSVRGSSCTPPPPGLVSWWPAEGSALDSAGGNNGTLMNGTGFTNGEVGTAFNLNGANNFVLVNPASTNLDVGQGDGFTIEGWVNPTTLANDLPFVEYEKSLGTFNGSDVGVHFYVSVQSSPGSLYANIVETNGVVGHQITSPAGLVTTGVWQHIALSYSKATGMGTIYLNGAVVVQQNLGSFTSQTSFTNILIGARTTYGSIASPSIKFAGKLDEVSVYNRALSASEIQAIYNAGSAGKCAPVTTACTPPSAGLVSWWAGESNALDSAGANNGIAQNITYTNGEAGLAFYLNNSNAYVEVPASSSLNVGTGNGFTFETWINPANLNPQPIAEWNNNAGDPGTGAHLWLSVSKFVPGPTGCLYANLIDAGGGDHIISTGGGVVAANSYQHIALTYDKTTGIAVLYLNGIPVQTSSLGSFTPQTSYNFYMGTRLSGALAGSYFGGAIDEPSLYNRALSQAEIQAIYNAGSAGKCAPVTTACTPPPAGIVGWWKADGSTVDGVGGNNGANQNISYTNGVVGQAFACDPDTFPWGTYTGIQVADRPAYALTNALTIETWLRPRGDGYVIFFRGDHRPGMDPYYLSMQANNTLRFGVCDAAGNSGFVETTVNYFAWTHVAATLNGAAGTLSLYTNGVLAAQTVTAVRPFADLLPDQSPGIGIGNVNDGGNTFPFIGDIDEIALYKRALTAAEVQSIYNAGGAGKCAPQTGMLSQQLINLDFGAGGGRGYSLKTGFAAIGQATNDFWNFYDRDVSPSPYDWRTSGALVNLQLANGALTTVGVSVSDAPGAWNDESSDSMYKTYDYPLDGGNNVVTFTNLAAGQYDVLAYSPDGNFEVTVGGISYGVKTTYDSPASSVPVWTEGVQYACFRNVTVAAGQSLVLTVRNGVSNPALLSGVQIVSSGIMSNLPPTILSQTPSQVVLLGNTATFSVTASGSHPLSYFWKRNGAIISGATNFSYTLNNAQLSDSGSKFSCLVTNAYGLAASTNATLKVIDTIANDLCSGAIITNASYTNVQSTVRASSFGDPVPDCVTGFGNGVWYQFTAPVNGLLIVDTFGSDFDTGLAIYTGSCDALTEAACNDDTGGVNSQVTMPATGGTTYSILAGGYSAHVGNLVFHLNYLTPPAFAVQPTNQSVVVGSNASFATTVSGAQPISFQWYFNNTLLVDGGRITGSTTASLSISNITTADAGYYTLTVTNFLGSTNSTAAVLTVLVPPTITTQPIGRSVPPGLPTTFAAGASGIPAPYYQWQLNGTNISGWSSDGFFHLAAVRTNNLGFYTVIAGNSIGSVTSVVAQLTFGPVAAWDINLLESLPPPGLSNVIAIAGSSGASFAVRTDGTIASWGRGPATNVPASANNVVALATSDNNYALLADGTVASWASWSSAIPAPALSNIVAVAAGGNRFGLALRAEGTVVGWGSGAIFIPASFVPAGLNHVTSVAAGYSHALGLRSDGTVVAWGAGVATNVPPGLSNVIAVAAGFSHSLALKANGTVIAWGSGTGTNLPAGLTNIVAISTENIISSSLSLALHANGTVVAWGDNSFGANNPPAALNNLFSAAIAAAPNHGLALVNDGSPVILHPPVGLTAYTGRDVTLRATVVGAAPLSYQWLLNGTNVPGATNTTLFLPNIQFANAGKYQLFVSNSINTALSLPAPVNVISNNTLIFLSQATAGVTNYQGAKISVDGFTVLGNGPLRYQWFSSPTNKNYTAVAGATNDTLVLDPALAVQSGNYYIAVSNLVSGITSAPVGIKILFARAWGFQAVSNPPVNVTNAIAVATGGYNNYYGHYLALGADGKVTAWGNNIPSYGETNVSALSNSFVTAIAAGAQQSLALKSDGTVYAWGYGGYGQTNPPAGLNSVTAIAVGGYHDLALKSDGTVVGWGAPAQYNYGQATNNPAATNVVAIAAGLQHSLALRADGTVVSWGYNTPDLTIIPPTVTNGIAIAAGNGFSAALRANGTVVQWGNGMASYPVPSNLSNVVAISASSTHCTALKNDGTVVSWGYEYVGTASNNVPPDLANVAAISSGGDHDFALFGTRAPIFTVQPWNRAVTPSAAFVTSITLAGKVAGVQPMSYQWRLNGTNYPGATNDTLVLRYDTRYPSGTFQLVASNAYGVAVSKPAKVTIVIPLNVALDTVNGQGISLYNWITSGSAQWFGETNITHDGVDAARSGGIGALQETILQATVGTNYSGRYTFWWKVSSEQDFDFLEFRVNGIVQTSISGEVNWQQASIPVAAGTNVLQWRYSKDASFDGGQDAGWVDQFAFIPDGPTITLQPVSQTVNMGTNVTFHITSTAGKLSYQWRQNGNLMGSGSDTLILHNVGRAQNGTYSVTVTDFGIGSTVSSNAVLKVLVPQLLGSPKLLPNGSFQLTSTDANGGLLSPSDLANFEAQASTNLVNWVTLPDALSLTNGMLQLRDGTRTNYTARYYRIIEH
jgi:alpha-tubulin suppressor-like RCC1 family protein